MKAQIRKQLIPPFGIPRRPARGKDVQKYEEG